MATCDRRQFIGCGGALTAAVACSSNVSAEPKRADAAHRRFDLGTVTYNIAARWDLATLLQICRRTGLAAVELRTTHRHGVEPTLSPGARARVRKQFEDAGIVAWGLGTTCEFHSPDPSEVARQVETCKRFSQLAADIGARGVKVRPNRLLKDVPPERTLAQIGQALRKCGQTAAGLGVEIWLEVHGHGTAHPPNVRTIMQHCDHPAVGITWNSNPSDVVDGSIHLYFDLLKPWIKSCHIHELWSDYPWRELFARLRSIGYDRYTLAEIPGTPDQASGERLLRYYRALWRELAG